MGANRFYWSNNAANLRVVWGLPNIGSTVEEFKAALTENPLQISGMIETPVVYTIPASDMAKIPTLYGENTIWMNVDGTINLEYYVDIKKYINKLIQQS